MSTDTQKDPILQRLEADAARAQNNLDVYQKWEASGRTLVVQYQKNDGSWDGCDNNSPKWSSFDTYRIRPEPRRIWVNEYPGGAFWGIYSSLDAANAAASMNRVNCTEYVEVLK